MKVAIVSSSLEIESVVVLNDDDDARVAVIKDALPEGYVLAVKNVDAFRDAVEFLENTSAAQEEEKLS